MSLARLAEIRSHFTEQQWSMIVEELGMRGTINCVEHYLIPELLRILTPPDWTMPPPQLPPELPDPFVEPPTVKS